MFDLKIEVNHGPFEVSYFHLKLFSFDEFFTWSCFHLKLFPFDGFFTEQEELLKQRSSFELYVHSSEEKSIC